MFDHFVGLAFKVLRPCQSLGKMIQWDGASTKNQKVFGSNSTAAFCLALEANLATRLPFFFVSNQ